MVGSLFLTAGPSHSLKNKYGDLSFFPDVLNRPRSIYQYSNMALRLSGQTSTLVLFSLYPSLLWELRDKRSLKNVKF